MPKNALSRRYNGIPDNKIFCHISQCCEKVYRAKKWQKSIAEDAIEKDIFFTLCIIECFWVKMSEKAGVVLKSISTWDKIREIDKENSIQIQYRDCNKS